MCDHGKHYHPYKCDVVPKEVVQLYLKKYPAICYRIFAVDFAKWLTAVDKRPSDHLTLQRKYWKSDLVKIFERMVQRDLHYEKSTVSSGHIFHRFGQVYRQMIGMKWHRVDGTYQFWIKNKKFAFKSIN